MRKLSEIKGEDALTVLADLIEPASEIGTDKVFVDLARKGDRIACVRHVLKAHNRAVLTIMAILEGEDPKTYSPPLLRLPAMLLDIFNDPDLTALFTSGQTVTSSGSAMENTGETETA